MKSFSLQVLFGVLVGILLSAMSGIFALNHFEGIILLVGHQEAVNLALEDSLVRGWVEKNFKIREAVQRKAKLEWRSDREKYLWQVVLTEKEESCCATYIPARVDVYVDAHTGKVLERVFKKPQALPPVANPACKDVCHSLYNQ